MKLNWFSPVPPTPSAIAAHAAAVLPALAERASLTVWVHELEWSPELEKHARVRHYDPETISWSEINEADMTIYHLGNHPEFHGPIWQVSRHHPGVVVLHDLSLQHFFAGMVIRNLGLSRTEYRDMMKVHHPDGGPEIATAILTGRNPADAVHDYPLTGAALENALAVAVHTQVGCSRLQNSTALPVAHVPLFARPQESVGDAAAISRDKTTPDAIYRIIMFGFLAPNRRLESILMALRDFPQKQRFRLDIYGTVQHEELLHKMIHRFGLKNTVTVHGFVPAAELNAALSRSDLAVNLRNPTMGEASASQLQIWQHGLPSLVSDTGWYATIPTNTVGIVRPDAEVEDIQTHLANFLQRPEIYRDMGRNGRRYVEEHHTIEAYVSGLLDLVKRAERARTRYAVLWMAGRAGRALKPWFADTAGGVLLLHPARTISELFDEHPPNA